MDSLEIREFKPTDVEEVRKIEIESFSCPWSRSTFVKELNNDYAYYLVGLLESEIVIYIGSWLLEDQIHITTLATKKRYRRQGLATELLDWLLAKAKEMDKIKISLEVRASNTAAQRLYINEGFFKIARKTGYYKDNGEDAVVMLKEVKHN